MRVPPRQRMSLPRSARCGLNLGPPPSGADGPPWGGRSRTVAVVGEASAVANQRRPASRGFRGGSRPPSSPHAKEEEKAVGERQDMAGERGAAARAHRSVRERAIAITPRRRRGPRRAILTQPSGAAEASPPPRRGGAPSLRNMAAKRVAESIADLQWRRARASPVPMTPRP